MMKRLMNTFPPLQPLMMSSAMVVMSMKKKAARLYFTIKKPNTSSLNGRLAILLYHGVTANDSIVGCRNAGGTHTFAKDFDAQMKYISEHHVFTTLDKALFNLKNDLSFDARGEVLITFDDGYRNNLTQALPICKRYGIKPIVFVTAKHAGAPYGMWTDEVDLFLSSTKEPVAYDFDGNIVHFKIGNDKQRIASISKLKYLLKTCSADHKFKVMHDIKRRIKKEKLQPSVDDAIMTWDEVMKLSKDADIGSHGMSHDILTQAKDIHDEINNSQLIISCYIWKLPQSFAYPNGKRTDFTEEHKKELSKIYQCAFSTLVGTHGHIPQYSETLPEKNDLFELKRISMGDHMTRTSFLVRLYHGLFI